MSWILELKLELGSRKMSIPKFWVLTLIYNLHPGIDFIKISGLILLKSQEFNNVSMNAKAVRFCSI